MTLAEYLRATGQTQGDFGSRLSPAVPDATVSRWAAGIMIPRPKRIREIEALTAGKIGASDWFAATPEGAASAEGAA